MQLFLELLYLGRDIDLLQNLPDRLGTDTGRENLAETAGKVEVIDFGENLVRAHVLDIFLGITVLPLQLLKGLVEFLLILLGRLHFLLLALVFFLQSIERLRFQFLIDAHDDVRGEIDDTLQILRRDTETKPIFDGTPRRNQM